MSSGKSILALVMALAVFLGTGSTAFARGGNGPHGSFHYCPLHAGPPCWQRGKVKKEKKASKEDSATTNMAGPAMADR